MYRTVVHTVTNFSLTFFTDCFPGRVTKTAMWFQLSVQKSGRGNACFATLLSAGFLAVRVLLLWQAPAIAGKGSKAPH